jgi:hypothetical protein
MALTEYTKNTTIIGALGTNPAERGLTTQEFKDKFDQYAKEFVAWFNGTHLPEVEAGLAKTVPACRAYGSTQSINDDTETPVAFDKEKYDTDDIHDVTTNNSRLTCKTAGIYAIDAGVQFAQNATGLREVGIKLNNTDFIKYIRVDANSAGSHYISLSAQYALEVNDYIEVVVKQTSGGVLNILAGGGGPSFSMVKVG